MVKYFICIFLAAVSFSAVSAAREPAQGNDKPVQGKDMKSFFQFSLWPGLGTNGRFARDYTDNISINLTVSTSYAVKGVAVAGVGNIVRAESCGVLLSGVFNKSGNVSGVQVAPLLNIADSVHGVQVGLINIADDSDFPIGIVNIIKSGEKAVTLKYDSSGNAMACFRSGGRFMYGIIGAGYNTRIGGSDGIVTECGLGLHVPCVEWFEINNEFTVKMIGASSESPVQAASYWLFPEFKIAGRVGISAGPMLDYVFGGKPEHRLVLNNGNAVLAETDGGTLLFGWAAGIQILF